MNWLDSHCHLNDEAFKDDLDNVLDNMVSNDVLKAMIISNDLDDYYTTKNYQDNQIFPQAIHLMFHDCYKIYLLYHQNLVLDEFCNFVYFLVIFLFIF